MLIKYDDGTIDSHPVAFMDYNLRKKGRMMITQRLRNSKQKPITKLTLPFEYLAHCGISLAQ